MTILVKSISSADERQKAHYISYFPFFSYSAYMYNNKKNVAERPICDYHLRCHSRSMDPEQIFNRIKYQI